MEETAKRTQLLQTFQVSETKCRRLIVIVEKGEHLSKGRLGDMMDTCDPYVVLHVKGIPEGRKKTRIIDNCSNPEWNERFEFILDPFKEYVLDVSLKDANYTKDEDLGKCSINLRELKFTEEINEILEFECDGRIHMKLRLEEDVVPDLRFGMDLCDEEKAFVYRRKECVRKAMQTIIGGGGAENGKKEKEEATLDDVSEVPVVGVLASGGGYRAAIGFAGVLSALSKSGILDCVTYAAALSGSSWCLAWLFSHQDFPKFGPHQLIDQLEERVSEESYKTAIYNVGKHLTVVKKKWQLKQPVSVTDMFGHLVGEMLLGERKYDLFSSVGEKLKNAMVPMPLCTCLSVKRDVSAREFGEWIEFSPYEFGWTKYGAFTKMENFGSKFYMGNVAKRYDELPLHFLLGCWGNAFSIIPVRVLPGGDATVFGGAESQSVDEADCGSKGSDLLPIVEEGSLVIEEETREEREGQRDTKERRTDDRDESKDRDNWRNEEDEGDSESSDGFSSEFKGKNATNEEPPPGRGGHHPNQKNQNEQGIVCRGEEDEATMVNDDATRTRKANCEEESEEEGAEEKRSQEEEEGYGLFPYMLTKMLGWFGLLKTRDVRAGRVFNPLRGLRMDNQIEGDDSDDQLEFGLQGSNGFFQKGLLEAVEREAKEQCLVDSGLAFNLPFPLLLRPQRNVALYLTFDFSTRTTDLHEPFQYDIYHGDPLDLNDINIAAFPFEKEIILAEKWARLNNMPFPPVKKLAQKYCTEPMREIYVFEDPDEHSNSPVIIHFIIYNGLFKEFKEPGIKRSTEEEKSFADFGVFDDPEDNFSMFKFKYSALHFERLAKLMEFNTLLGVEEIRKQMRKALARRIHK